MPQTSARNFRAILEPTGDKLRWVIAAVPFDIKKAWPGLKTRRVRGEINGFPFRTTLFPNSRDGGYTLLVNKKMQGGAKARAGDSVQIRLEPDLEERSEAISEALARVLKGEPAVRKWFAALPPGMRRYLSGWVDEPKSAESRSRRAGQCAEWLMLTMEGEQQTPPILRVAFERHPGAAEGWAAMSKSCRRNHLLSVFHYQSPEARSRRVQAVVEDALKKSSGFPSRGKS